MIFAQRPGLGEFIAFGIEAAGDSCASSQLGRDTGAQRLGLGGLDGREKRTRLIPAQRLNLGEIRVRIVSTWERCGCATSRFGRP